MAINGRETGNMKAKDHLRMGQGARGAGARGIGGFKGAGWRIFGCIRGWEKSGNDDKGRRKSLSRGGGEGGKKIEDRRDGSKN